MRRGTRMVMCGRGLEAECDGLGRGDDVLTQYCGVLLEGMGRGTPAVSHGGRLGAGWCGHVFLSTRSRMGREGQYCIPRGEGRLRQGQSYPESV